MLKPTIDQIIAAHKVMSTGQGQWSWRRARPSLWRRVVAWARSQKALQGPAMGPGSPPSDVRAASAAKGDRRDATEE